MLWHKSAQFSNVDSGEEFYSGNVIIDAVVATLHAYWPVSNGMRRFRCCSAGACCSMPHWAPHVTELSIRTARVSPLTTAETICRRSCTVKYQYRSSLLPQSLISLELARVRHCLYNSLKWLWSPTSSRITHLYVDAVHRIWTFFFHLQ